MEEFKYDLSYFNYEIIDNNIIIKTKEFEISNEDLLKIDLTNSYILNAVNDNGKLPKTYKELLDKLLIEFSAKKLKEISLLKNKIKDGEFFEDGYYYIEKINISYVKLSVNDCKKEILNLIEHLKSNFLLIIKLNDGKCIKFRKNI
jgi:hypothetical protein